MRLIRFTGSIFRQAHRRMFHERYDFSYYQISSSMKRRIGRRTGCFRGIDGAQAAFLGGGPEALV